jgi:hypothetical protein
MVSTYCYMNTYNNSPPLIRLPFWKSGPIGGTISSIFAISMGMKSCLITGVVCTGSYLIRGELLYLCKSVTFTNT